MESLGYKVRKFREIKGFKQSYMANRLGIAQNTYGKMESGETKISPERLQAIADIFETTPEAISAYNEKWMLDAEFRQQRGGADNSPEPFLRLIQYHRTSACSL